MRYPDDDDDRYDRDHEDDGERYRPPRPRRRRKARPHSELGIGSCVLAVLAGVIIFLTFVLAGAAAARNGGELNDNDPRLTAVGCVVLTGGGLAFIGVILGLV